MAVEGEEEKEKKKDKEEKAKNRGLHLSVDRFPLLLQDSRGSLCADAFVGCNLRRAVSLQTHRTLPELFHVSPFVADE